MRALRRLARPAVATAAAVLLLAGCGDDDAADESFTPLSSSPSSSGPPVGTEPQGGGDIAGVCSQAGAVQQLQADLTGASPAQYGGILLRAADSFDSVQPPPEIALNWRTLGGALRAFADVLSTTDLTSTEGQALVQQSFVEFAGTAQSAGEPIEEYIERNCPNA